jgi:seryl-tRNA synthetase
MHDMRFIRDNPEAFDRALNRRNLSEQEKKDFSSQNILSIDERRRAIIRVLEQVQARRNAVSKEIGQAKAKKDEVAVQKLMGQVEEFKASIPRMEAEQKEVATELDDLLAEIPNLPLDEVPNGRDANDNVEHHRFGANRDYAFTPKQHFDLGEALGQMDFEVAAKLSGARFVVLKKGLARLERALGQFMLDVHTSEPHNYTEVAPPLLVNDDAMFGTAQLPKFAYEQFDASRVNDLDLWRSHEVPVIEAAEAESRRLEELARLMKENFFSRFFSGKGFGYVNRELRSINESMFRKMSRHAEILSGLATEISNRINYWLIPTAEVPLTNLIRESIVDEAQLPLRYTACTPCFRAEAGAAGKDTRGMIRQHQFTKVELVSITTPEQSKDEHERMLACAEEVLKKLDLHYRVMILSTGDMGFASQKTYDIEVWLPGQNMYREISSCSICGEFQARRMNARYRTKEGRAVRHVHTLNGSGVAVGRALIAVMETYQQADGAIAVPDALAPYMGGMKTIANSE